MFSTLFPCLSCQDTEDDHHNMLQPRQRTSHPDADVSDEAMIAALEATEQQSRPPTPRADEAQKSS